MAGLFRALLIFFVVAITVGVVVFVLTNQEPIVLSFLYFETIPIWSSLLVLGSMALGVSLILVYTLWIIIRYRARIRRLNRRIAGIEEELLSYRNQPLDEAGILPGLEQHKR